MRYALAVISVTSILTISSTQTRAEPSVSPALAPEPQRRSAPLMIAGQVLTGFGTLSVLGGGALMIWGATTDSCKWGGKDCQASSDIQLYLIGAGTLVGGGGLGLGLGIPLWVKGAHRDLSSTNSGLVIMPGLQRVDVVWRFW